MSTITSTLENRDLRQRQIVPPEKLAACHAIVVGVGAIGRQVAIQLAAVGVPAMDLFDDDVVAVENLAPQAYFPDELGAKKVEATAALASRLNPSLHCRLFPERFRRSSAKMLEEIRAAGSRPIVFCCVDSISTRQLVWESVQRRCAFFTDGRMSAEIIRVVTSADPAADRYYPTTLFPEEQTQGGSCTAKSTVYTGSIAAGLMLGQFTRWLRGLPVDRDLSLNLLSSELACQ
jgi:molybdopterin-synthase adenylyltransferase